MNRKDPPRKHSRVAIVARLIAVAALSVSLGIVTTSPASAEPYSGSGQATPKLPIYPYSYNSTWQSALDQAITNWNVTVSPVDIYKYNGAASTITAQSYADTWYGYYTSCGSSCFYMRLNSRTISRDATNFSNFLTSVTVHEYGHALKLGHVSGTSIMNSSRNRNVQTNPASSDIQNVRNNYPGWPNV